jgi:hypothetical protein
MRWFFFLLVFCDVALAISPRKVEYAFRWNPAQGGPKNVSEVASLSGENFETPESYTVRYYQVEQKGNVRTFLRERTRADLENEAPEFRLKFRSDSPFPDSATCPFSMKFSYETDGTFITPDSMMTLYSLSCTGEGVVWAQKLHGKAFPCASEMIRYEGKNFRLEQWTLPAGDTLFEISRKQKIGKEVNPAFEKALQAMWKAGARPDASSKSELGSRCPE